MSHVERMRPMLGTFVTIKAEGAAGTTPEAVSAAIESAFRTIERVDQLMSFYRCNSDINRLNRARPGSIYRVHAWTFHVLRESLKLWKLSGGAFDCNVGASLVKNGLLPKINFVRSSQTLPYGQAICLRSNHSIKLISKVALDLGGIAKGFAVDLAVKTLRSHHMEIGMVNAGGDLRAFGEVSQPILLRCADSPSQVRTLGALTNGAIATSASYFVDTNTHDNSNSSAIVNVKKKRLHTMTSSISVIARNCLLADGLTKVAALRGRVPRRLIRYAKASVITS